MFPHHPNRRKDHHPLQKQRTISQQPLYQPSIYTFTCRGSYYASTRMAAEGGPREREGICRGFRSRLELLSDMNVNTRKGALEDFTYWTSGGDAGGDGSGGTNFGGGAGDLDGGGEQLNPQTKSVLVSPALIYKEAVPPGKPRVTEHAITTILPDDKEKENAPVVEESSMIPEEELIQEQDWSCYGSTQVDYLLLKNAQTGEEKIAAVAPRNNGLTIRRIQADAENNVTCIGIGWLSIVINSQMVEDEENVKDNNRKAPTPFDKSQKHSHALQSKTKSTSSSDDPNTVNTPEEVPPKPPMDSITSARESAQRALQFSEKIVQHMKTNTTWLYHSFQDDFVARTMASGQKIMQHLPVTIERTGIFMKRIVSRMIGNNDDDQPPGRRSS